jgi:Asp-tRNA(Asn)/Glu-tRNA(Gln) amidotransferase A subunit family amidase
MKMLDAYIEAWQLRELALKRELRPREIAEFFIARIEKLNPKLGAFVTLTPERALADAERLEKLSRDDAAKLPLFGVPYSIKDLTWTRGIRTTLGSKNYANFVPEVDAEVVVRMREAGGIMLGKTSTPEFGARATTEGGACPTARNPWNVGHTAGGSSGGAASALAAALGPIAEGSDGGGSIRIPSACCGTVGLKPARGRVSYAPVGGESWGGCGSKGPIARSVRDVALMLDVLAGPVTGDPYPLPKPQRAFVDTVKDRPRRLRLAALGDTPLSEIDPDTLAAFESACETFRKLGHTVEAVDIDLSRLLECVSTVAVAGIGSARIENPDLIDPVTRPVWEYGRKIPAAEYLTALAQMHNTAREIVQELVAYDALLTPTLTRPAVPIGTFPSADPWRTDKLGRRVPEVYTWTAFCFPFNATGQPAFSVPNGFTPAGLPIGLQIVGRPAGEAEIIPIAAMFEEARPWRDHRPRLD